MLPPVRTTLEHRSVVAAGLVGAVALVIVAGPGGLPVIGGDAPLERNSTGTVVVLGDSFTYATYLPDRRQHRWPAVLERRLQGAGYDYRVVPYTARGVGVERLWEFWSNRSVARDVVGRDRQGFAWEPSALVIQVNNMDFRDNAAYWRFALEGLAERNMTLESPGAGEVLAERERQFLSETTRASRRNRTRWYLDKIGANVSAGTSIIVMYENVTPAYANHVRPVAERHGWTYIDLETVITGAGNVTLPGTDDGVGRKHPLYNRRGHSLWADRAFTLLTEGSP